MKHAVKIDVKRDMQIAVAALCADLTLSMRDEMKEEVRLLKEKTEKEKEKKEKEEKEKEEKEKEGKPESKAEEKRREEERTREREKEEKDRQMQLYLSIENTLRAEMKQEVLRVVSKEVQAEALLWEQEREKKQKKEGGTGGGGEKKNMEAIEMMQKELKTIQDQLVLLEGAGGGGKGKKKSEKEKEKEKEAKKEAKEREKKEEKTAKELSALKERIGNIYIELQACVEHRRVLLFS